MSNKDHIEALKSHASHTQGENGGCVTRCKWEKKTNAKGGYWFECAFEGHNHRENGREYHLAHDISWYNLDFSTEGPARSSLERELKGGSVILAPKKPDPRRPRARQTWWLGTGRNFKSKTKPWPFDAHHIIPIGSLHEAFSGEGELLLLQQAQYNVNRGLNIMFLPRLEVWARIYELPAHLNANNNARNHPDYNDLIESQLDSIKNIFMKSKSEGADHPTLTPDKLDGLKKELENFSLTMREVLRETGVARAKANQLREPGNFISHSIDIVD